MQPLISVIMPTYNHEKFISQAIESVLTQETQYPFELLIGEDESSDRTREICTEYALRNPSVVTLLLGDRKDVIYIRGRPTGRANLLRLLSRAEGKYVAFCEGDDYWTDPKKLQKQVSFLECHPEYAGSCHLTPCIAEDGSLVRMFGESLAEDVEVEHTVAEWSPFHTSSFVFRKACLPWPLPEWIKCVVSADLALFTLVANEGKLRFFEEKMSVYRRHSGGITMQAGMYEELRDQRLELLKHLEDFLPAKYRDRIQEVKSSYGLSMAQEARQGRIGNALLWLDQALKKYRVRSRGNHKLHK